MGGKIKKPYINDFDLIIIGSGPAGAVAANDAAFKNKKVAVVESSQVGGECPNVSCLPTKALLESVKKYHQIQKASPKGLKADLKPLSAEALSHWKNRVISNSGFWGNNINFNDKNIKLIRGEAKFLNPFTISVNLRKFTAHQFLIATGSSPYIPNIPGLADTGFITYRDLSKSQNYPKIVAFIGGGAVAYEYSQILATLGVKVHILEKEEHILPDSDSEVGDIAAEYLRKFGVKIHASSEVIAAGRYKGKKALVFHHNNRRYRLQVDEIIVSSGKSPNINLGLEKANVRHSNHGIWINSHQQTSQKHIFAAGDVVGKTSTAEAAIRQAQIAVHNMYFRKKYSFNKLASPLAVYGELEIATIGKSEYQMRMSGKLYQTAIAPIGLISKSMTADYDSGFVKIIADHHGHILGASLVSPDASEMISVIALAISKKLKACDLSNNSFVYPSFSEAIRVAASKIHCI